MRYLIVSDIHSNFEALQAVVEDARDLYDRVACCGDLVGYGADPNFVVEWTRKNVSLVVRGNHDKGCSGIDDLEWFNPRARKAALWTKQTLTPDNLSFLLGLPRGPVSAGPFHLLHGSPVDEDGYLISVSDIANVAGYLEAWCSFFGHTHLQGGFLCHPNGVRRLPSPGPDQHQETVALEAGQVYLINPGSVGQPRDRNPRAAYVLYDPEERLVIFRRVPYDVAAAQAKIRAAGLPDSLADRLAVGS